MGSKKPELVGMHIFLFVLFAFMLWLASIVLRALTVVD